ncbi:MAG: hypothetical protein IPG71_01585 [bacterium]|nr:hypothetical protein [bacterium]
MSWGNAQNAWNDQDMNSSGKKLAVTGDSGGTNFQAEFADTNAAGNAVKVDGKIQIARGGDTFGVIKPDTVGEREIAINTSDGDPNIRIGSAGAQGNTCYINSQKTYIGGVTADEQYRAAIKGPLKVGVDDINETALNVHGNAEVLSTIYTDKVDSLAVGHDLILGDIDATSNVHVGRFASNILLAAQGAGAIVSIRGPVIVSDGGQQRPASLSVAGNITGDSLGSGGDLDVAGELDCEGNADIAGSTQMHGALTVGTSQANANATINGTLTTANAEVTDTLTTANAEVNGTLTTDNATVNGILTADSLLAGDLTVNGAVEVPNKFKISDAIECQVDAHFGADAYVSGKTNLDNDLAVAGRAALNEDVDVGGKFTASGATSLNGELEVQQQSQFHARTHHLNGVGLTAPGTSFTGIISQNNRLEMFVGGAMRFYVDSTGGHNA